MKHAQDLDGIPAHAIRQYIRSARYDEFSCSGDAPGATHRRMLGKIFSRPNDQRNHAGSRNGVVAGDILSLNIEVC